MRRIFVTGDTGYIRSHLCRKFLDGGDEVLRLDDYFAGHRATGAPLPPNPGFEVIRHGMTFSLSAGIDETPQTGRMVSEAIVQVLRDEPITLHGHGSRPRSVRCAGDLLGKAPPAPRHLERRGVA